MNVGNLFTLMLANTQLTLAQSEHNNLSSSLSTANLLLALTSDDEARKVVSEQIGDLTAKLSLSHNTVARLTHDMLAMQSTILPQPPPPPQLSTSSSHLPLERARLDTDSSGSSEDQQGHQPSMEVDSGSNQVCDHQPLCFKTFKPYTPIVTFVPSRLLNYSCYIGSVLPSIVSYSSYLASIFVSLLTILSRHKQSQQNVSSPSLFSFSPHIILLILIFLTAFCTTVSASLPPASFRAVSINANGLADPMKISAINSLAQLIRPHAIVIQETQSTEHVASRLDMPGYDFHESPGRPSLARGRGKWGVIIAVKHHLFNVQPLLLPHSLQGRAVALDITIPLVTGQGFVHRFIGIYAPWDPGTTFDDNIQFWPVLTDLCCSAPFSWSIIGDCNATL
jgi:hypothetical protein